MSGSASSPIPARPLQKADIACLFLVLFVAALLRIHHVTGVSYWFDESFCLKMVEFPFREMFSRIMEDPHPPFFYLVLHAWLGIFGHSSLSARMLGIVCGLLAVTGVFLFVREAYVSVSRKAGTATFTATIAALFIALSPFHISWSLLIRMYSLGTALAAFSSYCLILAIREDSPRFTRAWRCYTLLAILSVYTHYFLLFTVAVQYLFALGYAAVRHSEVTPSRFDRLSPVLLSLLCIYIAWLPWMIPFLEHRELVDEHFRIPPLTYRMFASTLYTALDIHHWQPYSPTAGFLVLQGCFLVTVLLLLGRRPADFYLALATSLPILIALFVSLLMRHIFVQRYFLFVQMFQLVGLAVLLGRIPWTAVRYVVVIVAVAGMGHLAWQQYDKREQQAALPGMQSAMAHFDAQRRTGEPLIICNPMLYTSAIYDTTHRQELFTQGSRQRYPFFQGTAVMRESEFLSREAIDDRPGQVIWTLGAERWFNHTWTVSLSPGWSETSQTRFPEFNCILILRRHERRSP